MTDIARDIYESAPPDPLVPAGQNPCSFHSALDTVRLRCFLWITRIQTALGTTGEHVSLHCQFSGKSKSSLEERFKVTRIIVPAWWSGVLSHQGFNMFHVYLQIFATMRILHYNVSLRGQTMARPTVGRLACLDTSQPMNRNRYFRERE